MQDQQKPPEWQIQEWLNSDQPISLASLRGKVVVMHAFQMLCPGCVSHGLPQAQRVRATFSTSDVAVLGLHSVFEHHDAMTPVALKAFLHEYRLTFPVGVDMPSASAAVPQTMAAYRLQGTPSLLLFDREGMLRWQQFGRPDDMTVGAKIMALIMENPAGQGVEDKKEQEEQSGCTPEGCAI